MQYTGYYPDILQTLRQQILSNRYRPGERLPRRQDLMQELEVSNGALQRVFTQLREEGFLVSCGRNGTRVASHPPHLTRFGVVFPESTPEGPPRSKLQHQLLDAVRNLEPADDCRWVTYAEDPALRADADYAALEADLAEGRLAALVICTMGKQLAERFPAPAHSVPFFAIGGGPAAGLTSAIGFDMPRFLELAFMRFREQGIDKVALLSMPDLVERCYGSQGAFQEFLARAALTCPPKWQQQAAFQSTRVLRNLMALLFDPGAAERPGGLIITDENFLEDAWHGLLAAGVSVPEDLQIICDWNFPAAPMQRPSLPITLLGFDLRQALQRCVALTRRLQRGESDFERYHRIQPVFEDAVVRPVVGAGPTPWQ